MAERFTAAVADVEWRANTGAAEVDIERLRRQYHEATQHMSTDALRASAAQDKLDKALIRHGPASREAKQAEVAYRQAVDQATRSAERNTAALRTQDHQLERVGRGALVGSGALRGFARAAVFASSPFLGAAGLTYAIRSAVRAASDLNEQQAKTQQVFGTSAGPVIAYANGALGVARDQALEYASTLGLLFRNSGQTERASAALSTRLVKLAVDMASFNNTSVEDALAAIRSGLTGEIEPLRRYGVFLSEARTKTAALTETRKKSATDLTTGEKVLARYGLLLKDTTLTQGDYQRTISGTANQEREAQKNYRNTSILIGQTLRPAYTDLIGDVNEYLGNAENQRRIQRDVNEIVRTGGKVAHGLAHGLEDIRTVAGPVVDALGGVEQTAKLMLEAFAAYKLVKIAGAIRGIGLAARFSKREIELLNKTPVAPKGAPGAAGGGGVPPVVVGGKPVGDLGRETAKRSLPRGYGAGGFLLPALAGYALTLGQSGETSQHIGGPLDVSVGPGDLVSYRDPVTGKYVLVGGYKGGNLARFIERDILRRHPDYAAATAAGQSASDRQPGRSPQGPGAPADTSRGGAGTSEPGPLGLNARFARAELALAKAREARDPAAERRALRDEAEIIRAEIQSKKKQFSDKAGLYDQLTQVEAQIQAIDDDAARKRKERADREAAAKKKRADAAKEAARRRHDQIREDLALKERRLQNAVTKAELTKTLADDKKAAADLIRFYHQEAHDRRLTEKEREDFVTREVRARKAARAKKKAGVDGGGIDFFSEAAANIRAYGSNIGRPGDPLSGQDSRALLGEIAQLLRENNRHSKETAGHTSKLKTGPDPMTVARAFAGQGL